MELESVAVMVTLYVPAAVGVPEMVPDVDSARPDGRVPEVTAQVYDPEPPDAESVEE